MWTSGLPLHCFSWPKFVVGIVLISFRLQLKWKEMFATVFVEMVLWFRKFSTDAKVAVTWLRYYAKHLVFVLHFCHAMHFKILHLDYVYLLFFPCFRLTSSFPAPPLPGAKQNCVFLCALPRMQPIDLTYFHKPATVLEIHWVSISILSWMKTTILTLIYHNFYHIHLLFPFAK